MFGRFRCGDEARRDFCQGCAIARGYHQLAAVAILASGHRCWNWADDLAARQDRCIAFDLCEKSEPLLSILAVATNHAQCAMGRQARLRPMAEQDGQRGMIGRIELPHQRVLGVSRLDQNLALCFVSSRPTSDLCQQLQQSLFTAEIGAEKQRIGIDNGDQRDVGKMMPLAQHLRADHQHRLSSSQPLNQCWHRLGSGHGVTVYENDRELSEALSEKCLGLLGAYAATDQSITLTAGALTRQCRAAAAVMTVQARGRLVKSHPRVAIVTITAPAAVVTEQCVGKAAAVEEHQNLMALRQILFDSLQYFGR